MKKNIDLKIETALVSMRTEYGKKKFLQLVRKAGKLFSDATPAVIRAKRPKKQKRVKVPAIKK